MSCGNRGYASHRQTADGDSDFMASRGFVEALPPRLRQVALNRYSGGVINGWGAGAKL